MKWQISAIRSLLYVACLFLVAELRPVYADPQVIIKSRAERPGEILLVIVKDHNETFPPSGCFENCPLAFFSVSSGTYVAFAGLDLEISTGSSCLSLDLVDVNGYYKKWDNNIIVKYKRFPEKKLKVDTAYAMPSKENARRAEAEAVRLNDLFAYRTQGKLLKGGFMVPVTGRSSSGFGERRMFNNVTKTRHIGVDLTAKTGTSVQASGEGKVVLAGNLFYLGNTVIIDHGFGLFSYYAHLAEILVREGTYISRGAVIGKVGATGRVTGPHLHWAVRLNEARIDPFSLVDLGLEEWLN